MSSWLWFWAFRSPDHVEVTLGFCDNAHKPHNCECQSRTGNHFSDSPFISIDTSTPVFCADQIAAIRSMTSTNSVSTRCQSCHCVPDATSLVQRLVRRGFLMDDNTQLSSKLASSTTPVIKLAAKGSLRLAARAQSPPVFVQSPICATPP